MSLPDTISPPPLPRAPVPSPQKTLHHLFLTLFLRGRTSRGLKKQKVSTSIGQKLALTLAFYALFGLIALLFLRQPVFALSVYLHALTFSFLGMFLASSAGEILFNKEEADILLHRPIDPKTLLWAKIRVLLEVSFWLAGAFNLAGFVVGYAASDAHWTYLPAHVVSVIMEALFCAGSVMMGYQLCLRWFGRERLEGLITTAQIVVAVSMVLSGQILPRLIFRMNRIVTFDKHSWWIALLPPAWFAGFDDAIAGTMALSSWLLAAIAVIATVFVLWVAFTKLAGDYETGLQRLSETVSKRKRKKAGRRWIDVMVGLPPLRWWLRDPVTRASFLLTAAYLIRDRDVKLRVYPAIAPMMALPIVFLAQEFRHQDNGMGGFGIAFASSYLGMVPIMGLNLLQYSQQWQASDVFRAAPMAGPASLCHGARKAVLTFLTLPVVVFFALIAWFIQRDVSHLLLLLPGIIALPVYALIPTLFGNGVPLSLPTEEAKGAGRGIMMILAMLTSFPLSGLGVWSWYTGWFHWFILGESIVAICVYVSIRLSPVEMHWRRSE